MTMSPSLEEALKAGVEAHAKIDPYHTLDTDGVFAVWSAVNTKLDELRKAANVAIERKPNMRGIGKDQLHLLRQLAKDDQDMGYINPRSRACFASLYDRALIDLVDRTDGRTYAVITEAGRTALATRT